MAPTTSPSPEELPPGKRKLRKGTRSCWECKRRKIRCSFRFPSDDRCIACSRRGTACRSQEAEEDLIAGLPKGSVGERLLRVELLLERLTKNLLPDQPEGDDTTASTDEEPERRSTGTAGSIRDRNGPPQPYNTPSSTSAPYEASRNKVSQSADIHLLQDLQQISRALYVEIPCKEDVSALVQDDWAESLLQINTSSDGDYDIVGDCQSFEVPGPSSHPTLLARTLLQLAVWLQQVQFSTKKVFVGIKRPFKGTMMRWVEMASTLVTSNDHLVASVEGLECLILEGLFFVNVGSLRRSWLAYRRALSFAQIMGIHRGTPRSLQVLDPRTTFSCPCMWARIVILDRYLALLLGTPSGTVGNFLPLKDMKTGTPTEQLAKMHCLIISKIIERNESGSQKDLAITQAINLDLQEAARSVPQSWWQLPVPEKAEKASRNTANYFRVQRQMIHYDLLNMLHLPFLISDESERNGFDQMYIYNKTSCMKASREILVRFNTIQGILDPICRCRIADFSAFKAAMTLLLAHLDFHGGFLRGVLGQDRASDRALVTRFMENMDVLNQLHQDSLSREAAEVTRKLLRFETAASQSRNAFLVRKVKNEDDEGSDSNIDASFHLQIPYFGTVSITKESLRPRLRDMVMADADPDTTVGHNPQLHPPGLSATAFSDPTAFSSTAVPQGFNNDTAWMTSFMDEAPTQEHPLPLIHFDDTSQDAYQLQPSFFAEEDDWAFQGVDMTFFSSIMGPDANDSTTQTAPP